MRPSSSRSPRAPRGTGSGAVTPFEVVTPSPDRVPGTLPVRRPRAVRRLRLPARLPGRAARPQGDRGARAAGPAGAARPGASARGRPRGARSPVPGDVDGLAWRTRVEYAVVTRRVARHAPAPLARRRPVDHCLIAAPDAREVEGAGPAPIDERVDTSHGTRQFAVAADGFWQVHPGAPTTLVETVLELLDPQPGEKVARPLRRRRAVRGLPRRAGRATWSCGRRRG